MLKNFSMNSRIAICVQKENEIYQWDIDYEIPESCYSEFKVQIISSNWLFRNKLYKTSSHWKARCSVPFIME